MLYEKALKISMVDKEIDQKETEDIKEIYNHYLDKRKDIMKNTQFKVEDVFGDIISKDNFSREQIIKLNNFSSQNNMNNNFHIKINLFKPRKKNKKLRATWIQFSIV